jgi:hypothetical protein
MKSAELSNRKLSKLAINSSFAHPSFKVEIR